MTLVCHPFPMPSESYYSSGVDVIYPSKVMNPHQFPEPDWNHNSPLDRSTYQPKPLHPFTNFQEPLLSQTSLAEYASPTYSAPHRPPPIQVSHIPNQLLPLSRPKSSPSTFGPNVEDLLFTENPFRMKQEDYPPPIFTMSPQASHSNKANSPYYPTEYPVSNPSQSPSRTRPVPIAPDPIGLSNINAMKRAREDEEYSDYGQKKRKRAPSQSGPVELNDEEQLLLKLKEEENLPWKDIAVRFQTDLGKSYQVPALQMRFKRLRERMRTWTDTDVSLPSFQGTAASGPKRLEVLISDPRFKLSNKPTSIGRSSSSTSLPQRLVQFRFRLPESCPEGQGMRVQDLKPSRDMRHERRLT